MNLPLLTLYAVAFWLFIAGPLELIAEIRLRQAINQTQKGKAE